MNVIWASTGMSLELVAGKLDIKQRTYRKGARLRGGLTCFWSEDVRSPETEVLPSATKTSYVLNSKNATGRRCMEEPGQEARMNNPALVSYLGSLSPARNAET